MTDWADDIELRVANVYSSHGAILAADGDGMIASALREARRTGIMMAKSELLNVNGHKPTLWNVNVELNMLAFKEP
jgi:hypothetical protein